MKEHPAITKARARLLERFAGAVLEVLRTPYPGTRAERDAARLAAIVDAAATLGLLTDHEGRT